MHTNNKLPLPWGVVCEAARTDNCVWDAAAAQQVLSSELCVHQAPSYVVQQDADGVPPAAMLSVCSLLLLA